jgi:hypothetical protein
LSSSANGVDHVVEATPGLQRAQVRARLEATLSPHDLALLEQPERQRVGDTALRQRQDSTDAPAADELHLHDSVQAADRVDATSSVVEHEDAAAAATAAETEPAAPGRRRAKKRVA